LSYINSFQAHLYQGYRIIQSPFNNNNTNYVATCSYDKTVKIWDSASNWTLIRTYSNHSSLEWIDESALEWLDADTLASCGISNSAIQVWSISSGQIKRIINASSRIRSLKLLSNGIHLAAGLSSDIEIYNLNNGNLVSSLKGHTNDVRDLVRITNSDLLASSSSDGTIRIWNLTTYSTKFILNGHKSTVNSLKQIASDLIASGSSDTTIKLWSITNGTLIRTLTNHTREIWFSLDLLNDNGQSMVSGGADATIKIWNYKTGELLKSIYTGSYIYSLAVIGNINQLESKVFSLCERYKSLGSIVLKGKLEITS
jgi:WD40 repeat protein